MSILDNLNAVAAAAFRLAADMLDGPERLHHDYDLPVSDAGAERLAELEQEREAWEANELFDQMASGIRTACGPYVRLPEWFGGPYPVSSLLMPDGSLSTERYKSSPLAGVQRAASPEGVSDETPDTPPPSGHTDAELLLAAAAVIEMDGADMLTELAADLRQRASLCESVRISVDHADLAERITATRAAWMERQRLGFPEPTPTRSPPTCSPTTTSPASNTRRKETQPCPSTSTALPTRSDSPKDHTSQVPAKAARDGR